jgi:hypothetical protein
LIIAFGLACPQGGGVGYGLNIAVSSSELGVITIPPGWPNIVFSWDFDEGMGSLAEPNGKVRGGEWVEGTRGYGLGFYRVGDHVSVEDNEYMDITDQMTMMAWVRGDGGAGGDSRTIIDKGGNPVWWIENGDVCIGLETTGDRSDDVVCFETDFQEGRWYHLAFSYDGRETKLWVNGVGNGTDTTYSGLVETNHADLIIGNGADLDRPFRGAIDQLKLYNKALSEDEIREVFREESPEILKVGLLADVHWSGAHARDGLPGAEAAEAKLKSFVDRMNVWDPDFVIQLGDLADSWAEGFDPEAPLTGRLCSEEEMVKRLEEARDLLAGLTMPLYHVWGNHEMKDPAWGYDQVLRPLGFETLEDTWYTFEKKGFTFVVMNTAHKEEIRKHIIPEEELAWLEKVLDQTENPTFVFMHVPIIEARSGPRELMYNPYDRVLREDQARALIEADRRVVAVFFGHMHHASVWRRLRREEVNGVVYYHITAPHTLMGDETVTAWGELTVYDGWYRLRASYQSDEYPTEWTGRFSGYWVPLP